MTLDDCVSRDTVPSARHARPARPWAWALAGSLALACVANAEPRELEASVVWTRADLVYVAASDSGVLLPGMTLSFVRGRHELASAEISRLLEPRVAVARLSAGSLAGGRRPRRSGEGAGGEGGRT